MQRPRATEADHAARAIVEAALCGVDAKGPRHVLANDVVDAPSGAQGGELQRSAYVLRDRCLRRRAVEPHGTAQEEAVVEIAEHEICVGQRRLGTALSVAGRARHCASTARSDP